MTDGWLTGWKQISAYVGVCIKTAQAYHTDFGMPVRRGPNRNPFALKGELDQWLIEYDERRKKKENQS